MLQYFRTNLKYRIIAIFLAIGIWFFVFEEKNPTRESVVNVPLEARGLEQGLVIASKPASVNVRFQGRKPIVDGVTSRDIKAYVKMTTAHVGDNTLPVYIDLPQGVKLVGVEPTYVDVKVDSITSVQLPVVIKITGTTAHGFKLGKPQLSPDQIMVLGPRNVLEDIEKAYVDVRLSGAKEDYIKSLPVKLEDRLGSQIYHEWVKTRPEAVEVFMPVIGDNPTRTVPVTYELKGKPAKGYEVKNVDIYPKVVEISSQSQELLQKVNYIPIEISVAGSKESLEMEVPLELPEGLTTTGKQNVKAFITIEPKG